MDIPFPLRIPFGDWINLLVLWLTDHLAGLFGGISSVVGFVLLYIDTFFNWVPWPVMMVVIAVIAWRVSGLRTAVFTFISLFFLLAFDLWAEGMSTLALVTTAVFISVLFGLPLGILAAKNDRFDTVLKPILDGMQTIPSFVYLIPAIMFFGIGNVPGILATVVFSLPPMVRLTNLGIRQVNRDVVEAGRAYGATSRQLLWKIQLPLAMPSIMTGVNQTVMMALSMVVVAAMIGAGGLGYKILYSIQRVDLAIGIEAGIGILIIAMVLDRILQGITRTEEKSRFQ